MPLAPKPRSRTSELVVVLLYALAIASIPSTATAWDGLGLLLRARPPLDLDYGHALYVPALRVANEILGGGVGSAERAAKLLSAAGATLSFWLLWRRASRAVRPPGLAAAVAASFATTPFFLRESGVVEPSTWTIATLLLAAEAAEAYGRRRTLARAAALTGATLAAIGFHLVSGCALLWIGLLARRPAPRPPAWHVLVPIGAAAALVAAAAERLPGFWAHWTSFLPRYGGGLAAVLADSVQRGWALLGGGAPVLLACAAVAAVWLWRVRRGALLAPLTLGAPYLVAFLLLGRPLVALLLPVTLALALVVCAAAAETAGRPLARRWSTIGLPLAVLAQLATAVPHVRGWTSPADPDREAALFFAAALPEDAVLFAGPTANHVRFLTGAPVVALPDLLQSALSVDPGADPIDVLLDEARRQAERGVASYLTGRAFVYLEGVWSADPMRLGLDVDRVVARGDDPTVSLVPIVVEVPEAGAGRAEHAAER